jgi:Protein-arginine deiminase (PAD)
VVWEDGYVEVRDVWKTTSNLVPNPAGTIDSFFKFLYADAGAPSQVGWYTKPAAGDKFVLIQQSMLDNSGTPLAVTVHEVLADTNFDDLNRKLIKKKIDDIKALLDAGAGKKQTYLPVPDLYLGITKPADFPTARKAFAFAPGLANVQIVAGKYYFARSYAPVDNAGKDIFEEAVTAQFGAAAKFVDDWELYHARFGEVHCGSLVKRDFWAKDWWKEQP